MSVGCCWFSTHIVSKPTLSPRASMATDSPNLARQTSASYMRPVASGVSEKLRTAISVLLTEGLVDGGWVEFPWRVASRCCWLLHLAMLVSTFQPTIKGQQHRQSTSTTSTSTSTSLITSINFHRSSLHSNCLSSIVSTRHFLPHCCDAIARDGEQHSRHASCGLISSPLFRVVL